MSELRVIRRTASLCSTWSLVPRPSTIPARTVSLAWLNRLYGPLAGWPMGSRSKSMVSSFSVCWVSI